MKRARNAARTWSFLQHANITYQTIYVVCLPIGKDNKVACNNIL